MKAKRRPQADFQTLPGLPVAGIIVEAEEQGRREDGRAWDLPPRPSKDASLARPQDQERSNQTAQCEQAAPGRQHWTNPEKRYARNHEHEDAQKRQRKSA